MADENAIPTNTRKNLRYDFTAVEIHDMSILLANKIKDIASKQGEAKSVASSWKAKIDAVKSEVTVLSNNVSNGFEYRDVDCEVKYNIPEQGKKTLIRSDTQEKIVEKMENWEHNLFTQVTDDELEVLENSTLPNPDKSVRRKSKKGRQKDDIQDAIETGNFDDI